MNLRLVAFTTTFALLVAACNGHAVLVERRAEEGVAVEAGGELGTGEGGKALAR